MKKSAQFYRMRGEEFVLTSGGSGCVARFEEGPGGYCIDQTGVGDVFVENVVTSGLKNVSEMMLTLSTKQELMMNVSQLMERPGDSTFHGTEN